MAQATDYTREARAILEQAADDGGYLETARLDRLCERLRAHDGWADWREIHASVYQASYDACRRRRRAVWMDIRQAIVEWGHTHNVNTDHARV